VSVFAQDAEIDVGSGSTGWRGVYLGGTDISLEQQTYDRPGYGFERPRGSGRAHIVVLGTRCFEPVRGDVSRPGQTMQRCEGRSVPKGEGEGAVFVFL
jgi:hypothetical protein